MNVSSLKYSFARQATLMTSPERIRCFSTSNSGAALAYHKSTTPSTTTSSQALNSPVAHDRRPHLPLTPKSPTSVVSSGTAGVSYVQAIQKDVLSLKAQLTCLRTEAVAASASNAQWVERMELKWRQLLNDATNTSSSPPRMSSSPRRSFARQQTPRQLKQIDYTPLSKLVKRSPPSSAPATARLRSPPSVVSGGGRVAERLLDVDRLIAIRSKEKDEAEMPPPEVAPSSQQQPLHQMVDMARPPATTRSSVIPHYLAVADAEVVRWREGKDAEMLAASRSGFFEETVRPNKHTARLERAFEEGRRPPTAPAAPPLPDHAHKWSLRATKQLHAAIAGESHHHHQRVLPNPAPPPSSFLPIHQAQRQVGGSSAPIRRHITSNSLVPIRTPRTPRGKFRTLSHPKESTIDNAYIGAA